MFYTNKNNLTVNTKGFHIQTFSFFMLRFVFPVAIKIISFRHFSGLQIFFGNLSAKLTTVVTNEMSTFYFKVVANVRFDHLKLALTK